MCRIFFVPDEQSTELQWPEHPPRDLELRLMDVVSYGTWNQNDVWDEVRSWLMENRVPIPRSVLEEARSSRHT